MYILILCINFPSCFSSGWAWKAGTLWTGWWAWTPRTCWTPWTVWSHRRGWSWGKRLQWIVYSLQTHPQIHTSSPLINGFVNHSCCSLLQGSQGHDGAPGRDGAPGPKVILLTWINLHHPSSHENTPNNSAMLYKISFQTLSHWMFPPPLGRPWWVWHGRTPRSPWCSWCPRSCWPLWQVWWPWRDCKAPSCLS